MNTLHRGARACSLLLLMVGSVSAYADEESADTKTESRSYERTNTTRDGGTVTRSGYVDVSKDEGGQIAVDRSGQIETSDGRSYSNEQQTSFARGDDGSGSLVRSGSQSITNAEGETRIAESGGGAAWQQNDEGGRDFDAAWNASTSEGREGSGNASARSTRADNGNRTFDASRTRDTNQGSQQVTRSRSRLVDEIGNVSRSRERRRNHDQN